MKAIWGHPHFFYPPYLFGGMVGPFANDFPLEIEYAWVERCYTLERIEFSMRRQAEGLVDVQVTPATNVRGYADIHQTPSNAVEAVSFWDVQRCVDVAASAIVPTGVAFELTRQVADMASASILERLPTTMRVQALDDAGLPVVTYTGINGENPCLDELVHPDPLVAPLRWTFRVLVQHISARVQPMLGPVRPEVVVGRDIVPPWSDMRYGTQSRWPDLQHVVIPTTCVVRYFIQLFGPSSRYSVTVGGRLSGYTQACGREGRALMAVTTRFA